MQVRGVTPAGDQLLQRGRGGQGPDPRRIGRACPAHLTRRHQAGPRRGAHHQGAQEVSAADRPGWRAIDVQWFIAECAFELVCIQQGAPVTTREDHHEPGHDPGAPPRRGAQRRNHRARAVRSFLGYLEFADPLFMMLNEAMAETVATTSAGMPTSSPASIRKATSTPRPRRSAC